MDVARFVLSEALARVQQGAAGALRVGMDRAGDIPAQNLRSWLVALKGQLDEKAGAMRGMPPGGATNTVLKKNGPADYDASWRLEPAIGSAVGAFFAHKGAAQTGVPHDATTKVTVSVETMDVSGWYDAFSSRFTLQRAGHYLVGGAVRFSSAATPDRYTQAYLLKNGSEHRGLGIQHTSHAGLSTPCGSALVFANGTTDHFELACRHNYGAGVTATIDGGEAQTYFWAGFLGTA